MLPTRAQLIAKSLSQTLQNSSRNYAAAAAPLTLPLEDVESRAPRKVTSDIKITTLENGIKVASYDNGGSVSRLSLSFKTGSRHEAGTMQGVTQVMKNAAFISNGERTDLRIVRETQQMGGSLESVNTRELFSRNAVFLRTKLVETLENIASGITSPAFSVWELGEVRAHCKAENATINPTAANLELLHKAAYRTGLGNSLYCDNLRIGAITAESLEEFVSNNYVGEKLTIVGSDVDHDELLRNVREFFNGLPKGQAVETPPQKYHSGFLHNHTSNGLAYASLVGEGAGLFSNNLANLSVLQKILGCGVYMKWGSNTVSSRLNKATHALTDGPLMVNALNLSYSDSGLFGVHAIADAETITSVLKASLNEITEVSKGNVTAEDIDRAKNQTKGSLLMLNENQENKVEDMSKQLAFTGKIVSHADAISQVDQVTKESVVQAAKSLVSGKLSLAVNGDASCAPYIEDLY